MFVFDAETMPNNTAAHAAPSNHRTMNHRRPPSSPKQREGEGQSLWVWSRSRYTSRWGPSTSPFLEAQKQNQDVKLNALF